MFILPRILREQGLGMTKKARTMDTDKRQDLSRRARQVMDIVYANDLVDVAYVQAELPDSPSYSAARMLMQP